MEGAQATEHRDVRPTTPRDQAAPAPETRLALAVCALGINALVWPGIGSVIGGADVGWIQAGLHFLGLLLVISGVGLVIGAPIMVAMWVWGVWSGVALIRAARRGPVAPPAAA